ncbi:MULTISPECIES: SemiSWEET transporter [Leptospira]|uniref:Sugar efflux transporter for intercellular exchange n=4 Tax=Leptospira weilii TaxID=28184 RepID=A0A828Z2I4_9LEPT|nr:MULTISPECIES: SemiSWEET transporter [Leptospira]EMM70540.1 sugar efflux transporter for intercellular exchange [Leptospira weilii str. 2006001855]EMY12720.1 sugar efflux transporter for intercellular exchange [Leptospira weilii str. Ecochallenge]EKR63803.1 sugar efflux transporter for intercellular exchange [Leptospira weilii str. 2006001853]EMJ62022.1 sugar efflux transporter for intercellular exchange [Leptospira sp. P2653]EMN43118.1 sugar efflux transporter for intercellular exchange [Le
MDSITFLGYIASLLTTVSFLPQLIRIVMGGDTKDISRNMYIVLVTGVALWFIYGCLKQDFPIILANIFTFLFTSIILFFKLRNDSRNK